VVTNQAIDLINSLLTDKEHRLSCRRYRDNDMSTRSQESGVRRPMTRFPTAAPYFIVADDAEDIKAHSFFRGVVWEEMHLSRPPWIPTIKRDQSLAKWFEDESEIMGSSEADWTSMDALPHIAEDATTIGVAITAESAIQASNGAQPPSNRTANSHANLGISLTSNTLPTNGTSNKKKAAKEKKRARCKILRDPDAGPTALAERKAKAFLGYTYRRPAKFVLSSTEERVGRAMARPSVYGIVSAPAVMD
jgi:protein-serine/threonine kinase